MSSLCYTVCVRVCVRLYLSARELAECVQQGLEGPVGHVTLQLLELVLGEHLHEVVHVQQDAVQIDAVDALWEVADHPPQTLVGG